MITSEQLQAVGQQIAAQHSLAEVRTCHPELHFTTCSEDDVSPRYRAASVVPGFALYYVTGASGHCLEITHDANLATGLLIASMVEDDE